MRAKERGPGGHPILKSEHSPTKEHMDYATG